VGFGGWFAGGILELSRLAVAHRSELAADFRELYSASVADVAPAEFFPLMVALLNDPRSRVQAVVAGWEHPVSREAIALYDLFDLVFRSKVSKPSDFKPYPRPWAAVRRRRSGLTASAARVILKK
jgi:hypothetical protein